MNSIIEYGHNIALEFFWGEALKLFLFGDVRLNERLTILRLVFQLSGSGSILRCWFAALHPLLLALLIFVECIFVARSLRLVQSHENSIAG